MACGCSLPTFNAGRSQVVRAQSFETNSAQPQYSASPNDQPAVDYPRVDYSPVNHSQGKQPQELVPVVYLPLSLRDAISAALADSSVVRTLDGDVNVASITPNDVMMAAQQIEVEQGRFQPRFTGNLDASRIDDPPSTFFGPGISTNTRRDATNAMARVTQPLASGGSFSMGIEPATAYLYFPNGVSPSQLNPLYSTDVVVRARQPVLQGAGRDVALAPIRISQVRTNQSRLQLEEILNSQIRSVTEGYWRLYAAHLQVQAVNAVLPLAKESVRIESLRMTADRSIPADVARAQVQFDGFRRSESTVLGQMRKRSLQLRQLMGGDPQIVPLLLPSERPLEIAPPDDPAEFIQVALQNRPMLNQMRERVNEKRILWGVAKNRVLPSLDLRGEYWWNGLSNRLDDSFSQTSSGNYSDWTLGFGVEIPIGNRTAQSQRQIAELAIAREQLILAATEKQVSFEIAQLVSDLQAAWQHMAIAKRQAQETQEWLRVSRIRYTQPPAANTSQDWLLLALTDLQSAMRAYVDAISNVGDAIADYSTLLAQLQQAQGRSVYEWQQQSNIASENLPVGGHSGLAFENYRSDPRPAIRRLQSANVSGNSGPDYRLHPTHMTSPFGHSFALEPGGE